MPLADTRRLRLVGSLHLQPGPEGTAQVVDDRTFTAAHVNTSARILLEALREPRTQEDLQAIFAKAADCSQKETVGPVARLVEELVEYGWVEEVDGEA
ncbi:hypothetical protein [Streptomyces sp. NL15-2K]|uniref:hypothetical protein n=1 Tax=Streptomyces sp. NL15-2K TaxID=376149 RepID=UPI000FF9CDC1|nr:MULTISPECIES: hypothetical protein [Actinomycetes]WKX08581.1 hypothetical protein Q4V64_14245 [Kutzneria buriramensis]GCB50009.1 hypothetical protein SNL152K_7352 [Streptomyces sp. NL15-2K]